RAMGGSGRVCHRRGGRTRLAVRRVDEDSLNDKSSSPPRALPLCDRAASPGGRVAMSASPSAAPATPRRRNRRALRQNLEGWLFASPWIVGFVVFTAGPMLAAAALSLSDWNLLTPPRLVGFDNFKQLLTA